MRKVKATLLMVVMITCIQLALSGVAFAEVTICPSPDDCHWPFTKDWNQGCYENGGYLYEAHCKPDGFGADVFMVLKKDGILAAARNVLTMNTLPLTLGNNILGAVFNESITITDMALNENNLTINYVYNWFQEGMIVKGEPTPTKNHFAGPPIVVIINIVPTKSDGASRYDNVKLSVDIGPIDCTSATDYISNAKCRIKAY
ncbi:MAG: hypothetical protein WC889_14485, partial [Myxococcota bacterium]